MRLSFILFVAFSFLALGAQGQQSQRFDRFELHRSVVYTTFLSPEIAAEYGIARGDFKAILTLSVRDVEMGETAGRPFLRLLPTG